MKNITFYFDRVLKNGNIREGWENAAVISAEYENYWSEPIAGGRGRFCTLTDGNSAFVQMDNRQIRIVAYDTATFFRVDCDNVTPVIAKFTITEIHGEREYTRAWVQFQKWLDNSLKIRLQVTMPHAKNVTLLPNNAVADIFLGHFIYDYLSQVGYSESNDSAPGWAAGDSKSGQVDGIPKKTATLNKWKKAYSIITQTKKKYLKSYNELETDDPTPKNQDYVAALKAKGLTYTVRQIRSIIKAGDAGLLK